MALSEKEIRTSYNSGAKYYDFAVQLARLIGLRIGRVFIYGIILCGMILSQANFSLASDDVRYWSAYDLSTGLNQNVDIFYNPSFRIRDDISDFFYHEHRVGLRFKQFKNLGIGLHYLVGRTEPTQGPWSTENRGEMDLTPKWKWGDYHLSVRGRAALRHKEGSSGDPLEWRFRLKPKIATKMELFGHTIKPYLMSDVFYDAEKDAWNQNRLSIGTSIPMGEWYDTSVNMNLYYMLQSKRGTEGDWSSNSVFGTALGVKF